VPLDEAERIIDLMEQSGVIELAIADRNAKLKGFRVVEEGESAATSDGVFA
jgi:hypothetical protein